MSERIIEANGVEICTEAFGNPADPALLLIIGAGASMLRWNEDLIARLVANGYYAIRFDNRDSGRSTNYPVGEPAYTLSDMAADAVAVLDAYGIDKAHVLGRSMGGMITQHVVLDYPERVATATLIYTTPSNSISGGPEDPIFETAHADALLAEIEGAEVMWLEGMGHALPEGVWDELVPRLLAHVGQS